MENKNAFTREYLRTIAKECGVEMPKEMEDALVQQHLEARNAYADAQVKAYQDEHPEAAAPSVKESQEYKDLKQAFDDYKAKQEAKEARSAKESAYRELLKAVGVSEKRIPAVLKVSDLESIELDKDGKIKDADKLTESVKSEWADFIPTVTETGADIAKPPETSPAGKDPGKMSMDEYIKFRKGV